MAQLKSLIIKIDNRKSGRPIFYGLNKDNKIQLDKISACTWLVSNKQLEVRY